MSDSFRLIPKKQWPALQRTARYTEFYEIPLGWSEDKKYLLQGKDGLSYLLRLSPIREKEDKRREFNLLCLLQAEGIPGVPVPFEFSDTLDGVYTYMVLSFAEGENAEDVLPALSPHDQYALGLTSGRILRKIHRLPAPRGLEAWGAFYQEKIDRKLKAGETCPVQYDRAEELFAFVRENRFRITDEPRVVQHGDYHTGNMVISGNTLSVIDFNRFSFGAPWEEFNRLPFTLRISPAFASGQIDGYFEGEEIPPAFFPTVKLYIAVNLAGSLAWAAGYGEREIRVQKELYSLVRSQWPGEHPPWHHPY